MMKRIKHKIATLLVIVATLITAGCKAPALLPAEKMQFPETYVYGDYIKNSMEVVLPGHPVDYLY